MATLEETKIIYHIDDEDTPYLIKLPIAADSVTLNDFKIALNKPNYKFFFKSMDDDFGVVKEELIDDEAKLPCFNGRVVSWLVTAESSSHSSDTPPVGHGSGGGSGEIGKSGGSDGLTSKERVGGIGDSRPPSFHPAASTITDHDSTLYDYSTTDTESHLVSRRPSGGMRTGDRMGGGGRYLGVHGGGGGRYDFDAASSVVTSTDLDSVSMIDSEDTRSRFSGMTGTTNQSSVYGRNRQRRFHKRMPAISQASSFSSITDSTMSLNIITVTLNMDAISFLGISIVGQTDKGGDGGIYVGSIMKGGAVAQDGRIEPGDMILEVNGICFEDMSNDEAVKTLRAAAQRPGPVSLVVAKCWESSSKGYQLAPRQEPVRPIDPSAWVAHTEAVQAMYGRMGPPPSIVGGIPPSSAPPPPPVGLMGVIGGPGMPTIHETSGYDPNIMGGYSTVTSSASLNSHKTLTEPLSVHSDPGAVVRAMALPDSGLEIRERIWLKITIPSAFIGSDLVSWLTSHVEGFSERREAKKYACNLLKNGYIRHTVNKLSFSEQCYYTVATEYMPRSNLMNVNEMNGLTLDDVGSVSEQDCGEMRLYDTLGPPTVPPWTNQYKPYTPPYLQTPPTSYMSNAIGPQQPVVPPPMGLAATAAAPYNFVNDAMSLDSLLIANGADTVKSSSGESSLSGHSQVRLTGSSKTSAAAAAAALSHNPPSYNSVAALPVSAAKTTSPTKQLIGQATTAASQLQYSNSITTTAAADKSNSVLNTTANNALSTVTNTVLSNCQ